MNFAYDGFTHNQHGRCFVFRAIVEGKQVSVFHIQVHLSLLAKHKVPVQEAPMFCLELLKTASLSGHEDFPEKFQSYCVIAEDFRALVMERERRAEEKALKKPPRRPSPKPGVLSNIQLRHTQTD